MIKTFVSKLRGILILISRRLIGWPPSPMSNSQKHTVIREYAGDGSATFVESGTFKGDTIAAMTPHFSKLISIELSEELFQAAVKRFETNPSISIVRGDSGDVLPNLLAGIDSPVVYWLDGHYSGSGTALAEDTQCPILKEFSAIISRNNHQDVILIDDARLFGWRKGYPQKAALKDLSRKHFPAHTFKVVEDIIVIAPAKKIFRGGNANLTSF